ncbi:unnamed protein product [Mytilus coruscus]|uniref:Uncharacterized protein n=1 Tax=Mytilus coruscus TaxID=42192 RepID=A0A6J8DT27_MYTCO|nr:unnamed protein product [Mytilus coruscus]
MNFVSAMNKRWDEVYIKVIDEFVSFDSCEFEKLQAIYTSFMLQKLHQYDVKLCIRAAEQNQRLNFTRKVFQVIEGRFQTGKVFLSSNENKQALHQFLWNFIVCYNQKKPNALANNSELTLAGTFSDPQIVKRICSKIVIDCVELYSTHKEADARMILNAMYADRQVGSGSCKVRITVKSPDTDVLVLCVHHFPSLKKKQQKNFGLKQEL